MSGQSPPERVPLHLVTRRALLRDSMAVAGGAFVAGAVIGYGPVDAAGRQAVIVWGRDSTQGTPEALDAYQPISLTPNELTTLIAAIDRIIPSDELGPGASESGVHVYIDTSLADAFSSLLPFYQAGLAALDTVAGSSGFASLSPEDQDAVLTVFEGGQLPTSATPEAGSSPAALEEAATPLGAAGATPEMGALPTALRFSDLVELPVGFFQLVQEHTRQGMFGDPIHGGNHNFVGWDLINYPGIKLVWTEEDAQIGTVVEPQHISVAQYQEKN